MKINRHSYIYQNKENWRDRIKILKAFNTKYEAEIAQAKASVLIYLDNSVGIGEHPQHIEEIDKQLQKIVDAQEKIKELQAFKL